MSNAFDDETNPSRRAFTATLGAALGTALLSSCGDGGTNTNRANSNAGATNLADNAKSAGDQHIRSIAFRPIIIRNGSVTISLLDKFADFWDVGVGDTVAKLKKEATTIHSIIVDRTSTGECKFFPVDKKDFVVDLWYDSPIAGTSDIKVKPEGAGNKISVSFRSGLLSTFKENNGAAAPGTQYALKVDEPDKYLTQITIALPGVSETHTLVKESVIRFNLIE